jgi:SAM-dependent methyltransferase
MTSLESHWDQVAERYDRAYEAPGPGGRTLRVRLNVAAELLGDGPGDALDVGMGTGRLGGELDRRGWTVSGVDLSPVMVEAARRRLPDLADRLHQGSVAALPFETGTFDAVVATGVLEYAVEELGGAARELARVLRPGGRAVLSFPNHAAPYNVWRGRVWYPAVRAGKRLLPVGRPPPVDLPLPALVVLEQALAAAGLTVEVRRFLAPRPLPARLSDAFERSQHRLARALATQVVIGARKGLNRTRL